MLKLKRKHVETYVETGLARLSDSVEVYHIEVEAACQAEIHDRWVIET